MASPTNAASSSRMEGGGSTGATVMATSANPTRETDRANRPRRRHRRAGGACRLGGGASRSARAGGALGVLDGRISTPRLPRENVRPEWAFFFLWRAREPASFVARLATRPGAHFTPPAPENMVAATIHAEAPAAADETPAPARMTLHVKVTFAWSNHSSTDHLTHNRDVEILDDGSETLAEVKARFAEAEGIPVEMVRFLWFDETIGRCARSIEPRPGRARRAASSGISQSPPVARRPVSRHVLDPRPPRACPDVPRMSRPSTTNPSSSTPTHAGDT